MGGGFEDADLALAFEVEKAHERAGFGDAEVVAREEAEPAASSQQVAECSPVRPAAVQDARAPPGPHRAAAESAGLADGTPVVVEGGWGSCGFRLPRWLLAVAGGGVTAPMGAPRVGVAGERHQLPPFGSVRSLRRWTYSSGKRGVRSLVRHDLPELLRASEGLRAEFDAVLAANEAAQGSAETGAPSPRRIRWTLRASVGRRALAGALMPRQCPLPP